MEVPEERNAARTLRLAVRERKTRKWGAGPGLRKHPGTRSRKSRPEAPGSSSFRSWKGCHPSSMSLGFESLPLLVVSTWASVHHPVPL